MYRHVLQSTLLKEVSKLEECLGEFEENEYIVLHFMC